MAALTPDLLPRRFQQLRLLAHTRRLVFVVMPLGALIGLLVTAALAGLGRLEPLIAGWGSRTHLVIVLPAIGLFLTTAWLSISGIGEVSLVRDLDVAHGAPHAAFPFRKSMGKVLACVLTIGFGGSAGVEGPGKWLGAALGLQYHRVSRWLSRRVSPFRRLHAHPLVMVEAGAAAALSAVFRAPLSGALMAAEHHGQITPGALIPCVVASATGYVIFSSLMGTLPLFPQARLYRLHPPDLAWAFLLGIAVGIGANAYFRVRRLFQALLARIPLLWRGLVGGVGLTLLLLPARCFWGGLPVTEGGGLELVRHLLAGEALPFQAGLFLALKLVATALTFAAGGVGGQWLPSFAMGAAIGAAFDALLGVGQPGYLTLVGAAAFAGATHESLLVPVVFLAETTAQAALVVPALVGSTVAYLLVREGQA
ncbi:chloride channel protein [Geothrix sp. 21YS21S-4]|uniref:chloride channel protein n=1 Tax=Geothrix sp. 21YS21S-4 TaxID=3068889 RepID=UPI0027B9ECAE|nr:chloride channel protein [Geothrix sp. 21YS21S-4]